MEPSGALRFWVNQDGVAKIITLTSLKQLRSEFVQS